MHEIRTSKGNTTHSSSRYTIQALLLMALLSLALLALDSALSASAASSIPEPPGKPLAQPKLSEGEAAGWALLPAAPLNITYSIYLPTIFKNGCEWSDDSPFGIQIAALSLFQAMFAGGAEQVWAEQEFDKQSEALAQSGVKWSRLRIMWKEIEPIQGNYRWTYYDDKIAEAANTGTQLIATIADNPSWAAPSACGPLTTTMYTELVKFVTAVVERYKGPPYNVKYWQLYNEPDGAPHGSYTEEWFSSNGLGCWGKNEFGRWWGETGADEYAYMLSKIYPAIKAADSEAKVIFGGIAYDAFMQYEPNCSYCPFDRYFIDNVFQSPGGKQFDIMSFHYFPDFHCEWGEQYGYRYGRDIEAKANYLREKLTQYDLGNKPIICTEVSEHGYPGNTESLEKQANYVVQGNARGMAAGLQNIIWFCLVSPPYDPYEQGLLYEDSTTGKLIPKPAYYAYQVLARELTGAHYKRKFYHSNPNIEGYVFGVNCDTKEKTVIWSNPIPYPLCNPSVYTPTQANVSFPVAQSLRVVDRDGNERIIQDGGSGDLDGQLNGAVTILVDSRNKPLYVMADP